MTQQIFILLTDPARYPTTPPRHLPRVCAPLPAHPPAIEPSKGWMGSKGRTHIPASAPEATKCYDLNIDR
jgi:hypothetical protein